MSQTQATNDLLHELRNAVKNIQAALDIIALKKVRSNESQANLQTDQLCVKALFFDKVGQSHHSILQVQENLAAIPILEIQQLHNEATEEGVTDSYRLSEIVEKHFRERLDIHERRCAEMAKELGHLISHYELVGGDRDVIKSSRVLISNLLDPGPSLRNVLDSNPDERTKAMWDATNSFRRLSFAITRFHDNLYIQKHAFYFREVKQWDDCLRNGNRKIIRRLRGRKPLAECLEFVHDSFLPELDMVMIGVIQELKTFGEKSLPTFLADEKEKATTRYVNITTIATFFSSVTATTLQFSYSQADTSLGGVVNLFWFLSLVFSVSSGVSSLLGMTWRKSSIYHSRVPPYLIHVWLDKAPIVFLIIAAVTFIFGLNLFAYLSLQPLYVSLATNVFTGLHSICLLVVMIWFVYELKHESYWAKWIRTIISWFLRPFNKYKQDLHLQRNVYWAFGFDKRVAHLNNAIDNHRDWPDPYCLSKLIRFIALPVKKCLLWIGKSLSDLRCAVLRHIHRFSHVPQENADLELGETNIGKKGKKLQMIPEDSGHCNSAVIMTTVL